MMKLDKLPETIDPSLNLDQVKADCRALVKKRAYVSAGAAVVPVPFLDVVVDAGILSQLLPEISAAFGLAPERLPAFDTETRTVHWNAMRERGLEFAGLVATRGVVRKSIQGLGGKILTTQVAKFIPLGGQLVAASMGYFVLRKVSFDHIDECYRTAKQIQDQQKGNGQTVSGSARAL
jgi:uncharacterized protein (DUF697 family)